MQSRHRTTPRRILASLILLALLALSFPSRASAASILYVKASATGSNNGTSWTSAYKSLQSALAAASSGTQIWVAAGVYKPTKTSNRSISFVLKDGVQIYGGFPGTPGTEGVFSKRKPKVNVTTLSGDIGILGTPGDNSYHVVRALNMTAKAVLDGFTITGGNANSAYPDYWGAGIYNASDNGTGQLTLRNLVITGNNAGYAGGGMFNDHASPTLSRITFSNNTAGEIGGGLFNFTGNPDLSNIVFQGNSAVSDSAATGGGGMDTANGSVGLTNVTFDSNIVDGPTGNNVGGGLFVDNSIVAIIGATFTGNKALGSAGNGGAIYDYNSSTVHVFNATFFLNSADSVGGAVFHNGVPAYFANVTVGSNLGGGGGDGFFLSSGTSAEVHNSIFWGSSGQFKLGGSNTLALDHSVVMGGCPSGGGVTCTSLITADPKLDTLRNNGGPTKTMALLGGSSAIDAGTNDINCTQKDQRGVTKQGLGCDIGAYEVKAGKLVSEAANDGYVTETGAGTGLGGAVNSTGVTFRVGDDAQNRRYRAVLSFDTTPIPANKTIIGATLMTLRSATAGNPSGNLGSLTMDIAAPAFGIQPSLTKADFAAAANAYGVGVMAPRSGNWYAGALNASGLTWVHQANMVQLRLLFTGAANNGSADNFSFFSANTTTAGNRPVLYVYYNP